VCLWTVCRGQKWWILLLGVLNFMNCRFETTLDFKIERHRSTRDVCIWKKVIAVTKRGWWKICVCLFSEFAKFRAFFHRIFVSLEEYWIIIFFVFDTGSDTSSNWIFLTSSRVFFLRVIVSLFFTNCVVCFLVRQCVDIQDI